MALFSTAAIIGATAIAGATALGATAMAGRAQEKAAEEAREAAQEQSRAQLRMAEEARTATQMSPEEKAYMSMMRGRAEAGLGAPEFETTTEMETEKGLEALQKYYMQRGWQPSPRETGLLIEPSQRVARDVAIQNALLRRQAQQQAWERAYALAPMQQELIERGAPMQALPYTTQAAGVPGATQKELSLQRMEEAGASQQAIMSMLGAYASPLLQKRIAGTAATDIVPEEDFRQYARFPRRF